MKDSRSFRERLATASETFRGTLWPLPVLGLTLAVALGVALPELDARLDSHLPEALSGYLFTGGPDAARSVLSAVSGSLVTLTSLTFSLTVVTLQLASSQFSPRLLRTFSSDRFVHVTLALFVATFVYSLTVLRTVRTEASSAPGFVPQVSVTVALLLALASVLGLVLFLSHLAGEIRVETLLHRVHTQAERPPAGILTSPLGGRRPRGPAGAQRWRRADDGPGIRVHHRGGQRPAAPAGRRDRQRAACRAGPRRVGGGRHPGRLVVGRPGLDRRGAGARRGRCRARPGTDDRPRADGRAGRERRAQADHRRRLQGPVPGDQRPTDRRPGPRPQLGPAGHYSSLSLGSDVVTDERRLPHGSTSTGRTSPTCSTWRSRRRAATARRTRTCSPGCTPSWPRSRGARGSGGTRTRSSVSSTGWTAPWGSRTSTTPSGPGWRICPGTRGPPWPVGTAARCRRSSPDTAAGRSGRHHVRHLPQASRSRTRKSSILCWDRDPKAGSAPVGPGVSWTTAWATASVKGTAAARTPRSAPRSPARTSYGTPRS